MQRHVNARRTGRLACVAMLAALLPETAHAASVTLANGDMIEGTVLGRILMDRPSRDANGNKTSPGVRLVEGKDISSIDATGVHTDGESVVLLGMKGATLSETLQGLVWWDEGRSLKSNQALVRDVGKAQVVGARMPSSKVQTNPGQEMLLGEVVVNHSRKTVEFSGMIRLQRSAGEIVTIPVSQIAQFTQSPVQVPR
jgi:hypothetical protein